MISLADAILQEDLDSINRLIRNGENINVIDEYGFTPLIEAAIVDNIQISQFLLQHGVNANQQDVTGGTALQWAVENNNPSLCKLLLDYHANPNAYNFAGQPILVMPMLRRQSKLTQMLINAGADAVFANDYINVKLLGHMFELVGTTDILDTQNQFVDVDFEGFYLEVTIGLIADSLAQFQNHFAARKLRRYSGLSQFIVSIMQRASELIKYQQYRVDIKKHQSQINSLLSQEPILIPVGYEGHAITFIKRGNILVKCDRREDSRLYDNIMFYHISKPQEATSELIKNLLYKKQSHEFINNQLDSILGLKPITELKIESQKSGNCSWANVEASIPAIFFMMLMQTSQDSQAIAHYKTLALNYFHQWREWNKDRSLNYCIRGYKKGNAARKACKAEILAAILFQRCQINHPTDKDRIESIISILLNSPYQYILQNYLRIYYFENYTEEGKQFSELLKKYGYPI
jgi:hypothetical protein